VDREDCIPGLAKLASAIHEVGGKVALQLHHAGSLAKSSITGMQPVSCSPVANQATHETPKILRIEEIEGLVEAFGEAARRAKDAGMDGIDFSPATDPQFLSPLLISDRHYGKV
jgi:2,4-dienoyl-CoA reductase (NADPH2)